MTENNNNNSSNQGNNNNEQPVNQVPPHVTLQPSDLVQIRNLSADDIKRTNEQQKKE